MDHVQTTIEGEVLNHNVLWVSVMNLHQEAERQVDRIFAYGMPAILIAGLAVEAFANFLIDVLDHEVFLSEKQRFRGSIESKMEWICEKLNLTLIKGKRPYQTIAQIFELRDRIVHAKPEVYANASMHAATAPPPGIEPGLIERSVGTERRRRVIEDVQAFCQWLNDEARAQYPTRRLYPLALGGPTQWRTVLSTPLG